MLCAAGLPAAVPLLDAQAPPRDTIARAPDSTRRVVMPRPPADTDSVSKPGAIVIPGSDLPVQVNLRLEGKTERDRNLRCNSVEAAQSSAFSGCNAGFLPPTLGFNGTIKSAGMVGDRVHVNVDYDMNREFDASQTVSLYYEGKPGERVQRVEVGNINFVPPASRFITSSLPSGNYGIQITNQFGPLRLKTIYAQQTGNVVQSRQFVIGGNGAGPGKSQQLTERETNDYQIERLRFFFTVDPALFGRAYPNIDILNRQQLNALRNALPDTLRPSRVLLYRLQFGAQPQNPNGPRFRLRDDPKGQQTYDLLREGVDYYMDRSLLWFALVRPLNETNERLVVAYNVRLNGRDTVWTTTGGTPDLQFVGSRDQVANLVMDPNVGPTSPAFRNEIRSVYRIAGEDLVRQTTTLRVVAGSGLLEHPIAGSDATFLEMFGLAKSTSPAEFDYENRIWPRTSDAVFNLGAGAADVRNGQSPDVAHIIHDYFLIFPSLRPFAQRDSGLVVSGNPTNEAIYTIPGEYLYSPQHPSSIYRLHMRYQTTGIDDPGVLTLGATQMRQGSERLSIDGRPLVRDLDYRIDYDLGRIEFLRPDTLFALRRTIDVRYEENPVFAATPTTLAGFVSELPLPHGALNFTAINQSQSSQFNRPQLGFEGTSTLTAGVTGAFSWDAPALTRLVNHLPFGSTKAASHFSVQGEVATSHPQFAARNQGQAFVETFDNEGGISIPLGDVAWYYSSLPAYGHTLRLAPFGPSFFEPNRAATLVWQSNVKSSPTGPQIVIRHTDIDPLANFAGTGFQFNEPVLWLSLLPADQGGRNTSTFNWTIKNVAGGRRFRSIRTVLRPAGLDLTTGEFLEFWTLLDTNAVARPNNPTLIFDFGDVSENSLAFAPETLMVVHNPNGTVDSVFTGRKLQHFDSLDTERDPFSHAFNTSVNDTGLPGDVVDTLVVIDGTSGSRVLKARICRAAPGALDVIGDPRTNCTIANNRLDEEDIDQDNAMNFFNVNRESERLLRYVVDLSSTSRYKRIGGTFTDTVFANGVASVRTRRWVLVSVPFKTPTDSLNDVNRRRLRALRLTVVSGASQQGQEEPTQFPIAELRVTGAPWLDRSNQTLAGVAGIQPDGGFVIASTIGTNDSSAAVVYQPPPGVTDQTDTKTGQFAAGLTQINERSMRIQAGNMALYHRAEAYFRFPAGPQNFFGFQQLRVWGRGRSGSGRGDGWGPSGDLEMYIKLGRDENNFYLYRTPVNAGQTAAAWSDIAIDFNRFVALRAKIQQAYLAGKSESIACTGADSAIIAASPLPSNIVAHRFAACDNGYMVYTIDPAVTAPNLAAVQELAVGIMRVGNAQALVPSDTLELWVDDIRLAQQVNNSGVAGQIGFNLNAADFADLRVNVSNRDPNFRQLGEQPTFLQERNVDIASTIRLDKLLPQRLGLALPLTITKISLATDPLYLSETDISEKGTPGLRKPKNDLTTYSLTVRRTTPIDGGVFGPLLNNLSATSSYVTGVDRTEFQDGNSHNFTFAVDYLVTDDSARTVHLPSWVDGTLGALPAVMQAGPIAALRTTAFRWNPTQLRITSGIVHATDRRVSFIKPSGAVDDQPAESNALSRLWRNGGVLDLRPTNGLNLRWEIQSLRDMRDYRDSSTSALGGISQQRVPSDVRPGFERERSMISGASWTPIFSTWFHPRAELGTQYDMLRDPNVRSFATLPGVVGVDSVLVARDSTALLAATTLPRRMTGAQTLSTGTSVDVAKAFTSYMRDSTLAARVGGLFAPVDVSYTRSLLSTLDAAPVGAPVLFQLGLGGPGSFRSVNGVNATSAGQTGTLSASGSLLLPYGTSFVNRYRHTATQNWIDRPDLSQAQVNGVQTQFPDASVRWTYRPAVATGAISNLDANVGYVKTDATITLPSALSDSPPEIRHTHVETFPIGGTIAWAVRGGLSTGARYSLRRQIDSLPGSVARSNGNELSVDAGRAFRVPQSWGLGLRNDIRTRVGVQESHNTTYVLDASGAVQSRLQDNGRQSFNLTADTNLQDNLVFTFQGSHVVVFDNNLNRRFAQTLFSTVLQVQFFATPK